MKTERVIFENIVVDTKPFELQGGLYRIGAVISGPNNLHLQTLAPDGQSWVDCLDHPIATSGLSEEIKHRPRPIQVASFDRQARLSCNNLHVKLAVLNNVIST